MNKKIWHFEFSIFIEDRITIEIDEESCLFDPNEDLTRGYVFANNETEAEKIIRNEYEKGKNLEIDDLCLSKELDKKTIDGIKILVSIFGLYNRSIIEIDAFEGYLETYKDEDGNFSV